jgi:hypothetical protein
MVFDMMPDGYDVSSAAQLLEALGDEGRRFFLSQQILRDTAYPLFFAVSIYLNCRVSDIGRRCQSLEQQHQRRGQRQAVKMISPVTMISSATTIT